MEALSNLLQQFEDALSLSEKRSVVRRRGGGGRALRCPPGEVKDKKTGRCRRKTPAERAKTRRKRVKQRQSSRKSARKRTKSKRQRQKRQRKRFKRSRGIKSSTDISKGPFTEMLNELRDVVRG